MRRALQSFDRPGAADVFVFKWKPTHTHRHTHNHNQKQSANWCWLISKTDAYSDTTYLTQSPFPATRSFQLTLFHLLCFRRSVQTQRSTRQVLRRISSNLLESRRISQALEVLFFVCRCCLISWKWRWNLWVCFWCSALFWLSSGWVKVRPAFVPATSKRR